MVLLTQIGTDSAYLTHVAPGLVLLGPGIGMVFSSAFSSGTIGVASEDVGVALATVDTFQQIGGSFGTALLSTCQRGEQLSDRSRQRSRGRAGGAGARLHHRVW